MNMALTTNPPPRLSAFDSPLARLTQIAEERYL